MIDFSPGMPFHKVYGVVLLWIASGIIGLTVRCWLLVKYRYDLRVSKQLLLVECLQQSSDADVVDATGQDLCKDRELETIGAADGADDPNVVLSKARITVSQRAIASTCVHIVVKLLVIAVGLSVAATEWGTPIPRAPSFTFSIGLLLMPWLLTVDGLMEFLHQRWLLSLVGPITQAGHHLTHADHEHPGPPEVRTG